jgi:hypothetical protein
MSKYAVLVLSLSTHNKPPSTASHSSTGAPSSGFLVGSRAMFQAAQKSPAMRRHQGLKRWIDRVISGPVPIV